MCELVIVGRGFLKNGNVYLRSRGGVEVSPLKYLLKKGQHGFFLLCSTLVKQLCSICSGKLVETALSQFFLSQLTENFPILSAILLPILPLLFYTYGGKSPIPLAYSYPLSELCLYHQAGWLIDWPRDWLIADAWRPVRSWVRILCIIYQSKQYINISNIGSVCFL